MWKEELPENCPPTSAESLNVDTYRILVGETAVEEDFLTYAKMHPENKRYQSLCEANALSSYDTRENALIAWKKALKRGKRIGNYIAKVYLTKEHGVNHFKEKTGHLSTWVFSAYEENTFDCHEINLIDED